MLMALLDGGDRFARNSPRMLPSVIVVLCSLGLLLVSAGSDDEKFHSSSSDGCAAADAAAGLGVDVLNTANGSDAGWACCAGWGWGCGWLCACWFGLGVAG